MRLPAIQRALGVIVPIFRQSVTFCGGRGIVILAAAILPMLKVGGSFSQYDLSHLIPAGTAVTMVNPGPGLGEVNVHFRGMNTAGVWASSVAMVPGRLEVFTVLVRFLPGLWRE